SGRLPSRRRRLCDRLRLRFLLVAGTFEMAPGLREEDVVQRRLVDLQLREDDPFGVQRADDLGEIAVRRAQLDRDAARAVTGRLLAEALEDGCDRASLVGIRGNRLDRGAGDVRPPLL